MSDPNREDGDSAPRGAEGAGQPDEPGRAPGKAERDPPADPAHDPMAPPAEPCECFCLHCGRTFPSDKMWFQRVVGAKDGFPGFWMCPTANCSGAGFTFDIFPTDPAHPANDGWVDTDADEDDDDDEEGDDDPHHEGDEEMPWDEGDDEDADGGETAAAEWDADESKYKAMDEWADDEDDLEGEEWKHGLAPGERPKAQAPPPGVEPRSQAEQEALYDEPDRRPRELDWSNRDDRPDRPERGDGFTEDDIPF